MAEPQKQPIKSRRPPKVPADVGGYAMSGRTRRKTVIVKRLAVEDEDTTLRRDGDDPKRPWM